MQGLRPQARKLAICLTKRINRAIYRLHPTRLLDEPVTETNVLGALAVRNLAYMLNPIITGALLKKNHYEKVYPRLPEQKEFQQRGFSHDPKKIMKEVKTLLFEGRVPISSAHAFPGDEDTLSFSDGVGAKVFDALSVEAKQVIRTYITQRSRSGVLAETQPESTNGTAWTSPFPFGPVRLIYGCS